MILSVTVTDSVFAMLLPNTARDEAILVAKRLEEALQFMPGVSGPILVCVGIASTPDQAGDALPTIAAKAPEQARQLGTSPIAHANQSYPKLSSNL
jgi:GGDEF domain-containing protein